MLNMNNEKDKEKMMKYYRTSEMLNLLNFFPEISPIKELIIVESLEEINENKEFIDTFEQNRVDTLKGRKPISGIENAGFKNGFYDTLVKVKQKDPQGVLVLFKIDTTPTERYERYAGISVGVNLGVNVLIDAVGQGFDGREVSKSICTHERYNIPWYDLRKVTINNFKDYQTYKITDEEYKRTRQMRVLFLKSIGLDEKIFSSSIPLEYQDIPDFIWLDIIKNILKRLEKMEDILKSVGLTCFAISGHTEGCKFAPWSMFDKTRYTD